MLVQVENSEFELVWVVEMEADTLPLPVLSIVKDCVGELDTEEQVLAPPEAVPVGPAFVGDKEGVEDMHTLPLPPGEPVPTVGV